MLWVEKSENRNELVGASEKQSTGEPEGKQIITALPKQAASPEWYQPGRVRQPATQLSALASSLHVGIVISKICYLPVLILMAMHFYVSSVWLSRTGLIIRQPILSALCSLSCQGLPVCVFVLICNYHSERSVYSAWSISTSLLQHLF